MISPLYLRFDLSKKEKGKSNPTDIFISHTDFISHTESTEITERAIRIESCYDYGRNVAPTFCDFCAFCVRLIQNSLCEKTTLSV